MKHSIAYILVSMLVSTTPAVSADDWTLSLDLHGASKHFGTDRDFNGQNAGVGFQLNYGKNSVLLGQYNNSLYSNTNYVGYARSILEKGPFKLSAGMAAATGYMEMNDACSVKAVDGDKEKSRSCESLPVVPIPSLTLSISTVENARLKLVYIPRTVPGTLSVLAVSMSIQIF